MDMYFRDKKFTNEVAMKYLNTCVVVDLLYLENKRMRIWVSYEYIDVDGKDKFCERVRMFLNAHYYEYANRINEYVE